MRATLAFFALPGLVAFAVPLLMLRPPGSGRPFVNDGLTVVIPGCVVLFWCIREFYVRGHGTLAPWDPPRELVLSGLYRYSRNPMYVGVLLIVLGWALGFRSATLLGYAVALAVAFHLRVVLGEEPWLERTHGMAWTEYRARVPRWLV